MAEYKCKAHLLDFYLSSYSLNSYEYCYNALQNVPTVSLIPVSMYYVLYTLVFVVADKLGTGESDVLRHSRRTRILSVSAVPQAEKPGQHHYFRTFSKDVTKAMWNHSWSLSPPLLERHNDEVFVQTKYSKWKETLGNSKQKQAQATVFPTTAHTCISTDHIIVQIWNAKIILAVLKKKQKRFFLSFCMRMRLFFGWIEISVFHQISMETFITSQESHDQRLDDQQPECYWWQKQQRRQQDVVGWWCGMLSMTYHSILIHMWF